MQEIEFLEQNSTKKYKKVLYSIFIKWYNCSNTFLRRAYMNEFYQCPNCGRSVLLTMKTKKWGLKTKTEKGEEWAWFVTCPFCTIDSEYTGGDISEKTKCCTAV